MLKYEFQELFWELTEEQGFSCKFSEIEDNKTYHVQLFLNYGLVGQIWTKSKETSTTRFTQECTSKSLGAELQSMAHMATYSRCLGRPDSENFPIFFLFLTILSLVFI